jgi:L-iditol 2-dehydrogenase
MMHVKLARLRGAGRILVVEPNPERAAWASTHGADRVINPRDEDLNTLVVAESGGEGADVILVAAPSAAAQQQAIQMAAIGGRINFFGGLPKESPFIQLDANRVHYKELLVTGTTACSTADCREAAQIVSSGRLDLSDLISRRYPLAQIAEAFIAAESGQELKVIIEP